MAGELGYGMDTVKVTAYTLDGIVAGESNQPLQFSQYAGDTYWFNYYRMRLVAATVRSVIPFGPVTQGTLSFFLSSKYGPTIALPVLSSANNLVTPALNLAHMDLESLNYELRGNGLDYITVQATASGDMLPGGSGVLPVVELYFRPSRLIGG